MLLPAHYALTLENVGTDCLANNWFECFVDSPMQVTKGAVGHVQSRPQVMIPLPVSLRAYERLCTSVYPRLINTF